MGGSTKAPLACLAWPTGEFGGMGLEGAVRLGYRRELGATDDPDAREDLFQELVARMYEIGKALSVASYFEIDDVIDPADTRRWLTALLEPRRRRRCPGKKRRTSTPGDHRWRPGRRGRRVSPRRPSSPGVSWRPGSGSASPPSPAVDRARSARRRDRGARPGHVHERYQAYGAPRPDRGVARAMLPAPRSACRSGCSCSAGPTTGAGRRDRRRRARRRGRHRLGVDLRHAGPGLDVAGGAVSGALTMSAGVNGPPLVFVLRPATSTSAASGRRSRRSSPSSTSSASSPSPRRARSTGTSSSPSPSPCRASLGARRSRCVATSMPPLPPPRAHPADRRRLSALAGGASPLGVDERCQRPNIVIHWSLVDGRKT